MLIVYALSILVSFFMLVFHASILSIFLEPAYQIAADDLHIEVTYLPKRWLNHLVISRNRTLTY